MISERDLAEKFGVIWKQHFPFLTSNFIRVFNETQVKKINTNSIEITNEVRFDLVSELAFNLSEILFSKKISVDEYRGLDINLEDLASKTIKSIWPIGTYTNSDYELTKYEFNEIFKITENIIQLLNLNRVETIVFRPILKGYGFIPDLVADLSIGNTLYEIKTVNRNFKSSDLKQLFIYLALEQVSKKGNWEYAGLYNPRKGTISKFNIKTMIYNLSGGKTTNEVFEKLLNGFVRDIEIDSRF